MHDASSLTTTDASTLELTEWLTDAGLRGVSRAELLETYCRRLVEKGVPLLRFHLTMTAVHPSYGGIGFNWRAETGTDHMEYAHSTETPVGWQTSPFLHMLTQNLSSYRERLSWDQDSRFPLLNDMREEGATEYLAQAVLFEEWDDSLPLNPQDSVDGALMSWMVNSEDGFTQQDLDLIQTTFPHLALALKSTSHRKMAEDLLGVYLGRDAGRRVLSGEIERGSTRWINAVICYFDFEGFTSLSQRLDGEALIAMLNAYFEPVVAAIEAQGGNVLKFMGDGLLAIFDRDEFPDAADRALRAMKSMDLSVRLLSAERAAEGAHTFNYTAALHVGRVLYGNIGAPERLDFTVIGPDVNLAARIGGMHKALGQDIILSGPLVAQLSPTSVELVSLGRYMLRGVAHPQELFTIYVPEASD